MKHIKRFNESSEYSKVSDYIKEIMLYKINFSVTRTEEDLEDDETIVIQSIEIDGNIITVENDIWTGGTHLQNNYSLLFNDKTIPKELEIKKNIIEDLNDNLSFVKSRTTILCNYLQKYMDYSSYKLTTDEIREKCLEFELTKDYIFVDPISLNQLFDYYELDWKYWGDRVLEGLKNHRFLPNSK